MSGIQTWVLRLVEQAFYQLKHSTSHVKVSSLILLHFLFYCEIKGQIKKTIMIFDYYLAVIQSDFVT